MYKLYNIKKENAVTIEKIRKAIKNGVNVNEQDKNGNTLLMLLSFDLKETNLDAFKFLAKLEVADINISNKQSETALMLLFKDKGGYSKKFKLLNGAIEYILKNKKIKDRKSLDFSLWSLGCCLVHSDHLFNDMVKNFNLCVPSINLLLKAGANPNRQVNSNFPFSCVTMLLNAIVYGQAHRHPIIKEFRFFNESGAMIDFIQCILNNSQRQAVDLIINATEQQKYLKELLQTDRANKLSFGSVKDYFSLPETMKKSVFTFCCVVNRWNKFNTSSESFKNDSKLKFPKVMQNLVVEEMCSSFIFVKNTKDDFIFAFDVKNKIIIESKEQLEHLLKQDVHENKEDVPDSIGNVFDSAQDNLKIQSKGCCLN